MKYHHRFQVNAPISRVAGFFHQPANMSAITPPFIRVQLHHDSTTLSGGGEMDFTLWIGPLPIHWVACIEDVSETGFTDRQVSGPFSRWEHRHSFTRVNYHATEVMDYITLELKPHPLWWLVGVGFWLGLPALFTYRAWKIRRLLEQGSD